MELLEVQSNGKTSKASERRRTNISFIERLPLKDLAFEKREMMLFLYETNAKEQICLQYPGKESKETKRRKNINPRDFRPKVIKNGVYGRDLSFGEVWGSFFDLLKKHTIKDNDFLKAIDYLIILLYKSAYLMNFKEYKTLSLKVSIVEEGLIKEPKVVKLYAPVLLYNIEMHKEMISFIQNKIGNLCGMSVEAFILYNDILGWNEDYKYYQKGLTKGKEWSNGTGKPNTLLTHISILGYIRGEFKMTDILNRFVRTRGVSAPTGKELEKLFEDYINPEIKKLSL